MRAFLDENSHPPYHSRRRACTAARHGRKPTPEPACFWLMKAHRRCDFCRNACPPTKDFTSKPPNASFGAGGHKCRKITDTASRGSVGRMRGRTRDGWVYDHAEIGAAMKRSLRTRSFVSDERQAWKIRDREHGNVVLETGPNAVLCENRDYERRRGWSIGANSVVPTGSKRRVEGADTSVNPAEKIGKGEA